MIRNTIPYRLLRSSPLLSLGNALRGFFGGHQAFRPEGSYGLVEMSDFYTFGYNENSGENKGLSFGTPNSPYLNQK
jgi:hypothetical protein